MSLLHVHGRGHEALAAGDVGRRQLAVGRLQVVDQDRAAAAVQGSAGVVVQVLQGVGSEGKKRLLTFQTLTFEVSHLLNSETDGRRIRNTAETHAGELRAGCVSVTETGSPPVGS